MVEKGKKDTLKKIRARKRLKKDETEKTIHIRLSVGGKPEQLAQLFRIMAEALNREPEGIETHAVDDKNNAL